jgi:hypothetical protein
VIAPGSTLGHTCRGQGEQQEHERQPKSAGVPMNGHG